MTERPPFFELFTRLRKAGIALGIDEYKLLITALEGGFGIEDLDALANLCKTLWVRSDEELRTFERVFSEITQHEQAFPGPEPETEAPSRKTGPLSSPLSHQPTSEPSSVRDSTQRREQQEIQAILQAGAVEPATSRFERGDEYFPVTRRQMKQSWRYLRHPERLGLPTELDIEKTVEEIGRTGILSPIFRSRYINRAEMLLLIDQGGSMVPFHELSARLSETALHEGRLTSISVYYFRNYPTDRLFRTPSLRDDVQVQDVLQSLHYDHSSVLIFSDAGAARGYFSRRRFEGTRTFLTLLAAHVRYQAWLNPMPSERWLETTAQSIQEFLSIPMFDIGQRGLEQAINVLRGRSTV